jgi:hypothetical protein
MMAAFRSTHHCAVEGVDAEGGGSALLREAWERLGSSAQVWAAGMGRLGSGLSIVAHEVSLNTCVFGLVLPRCVASPVGERGAGVCRRVLRTTANPGIESSAEASSVPIYEHGCLFPAQLITPRNEPPPRWWEGQGEVRCGNGERASRRTQTDLMRCEHSTCCGCSGSARMRPYSSRRRRAA